MTTSCSVVRRLTGRWAVFATSSLLVLVLAFSGCATRREVADIVARSNAAIISSQLGGLPSPAGKEGTAKPWEGAALQIDAFAEAHPDQKAAVAPLRIRQAMLYLTYRQFNLAQAAFNAASLEDLHTDRDKALKRNQETLLWWFGASTNDTWSTTDRSMSEAALKSLKEEQILLEPSLEMRDYLAEMRAWIGLAAAKQTVSTNRARELIEETLDVYGDVFTPDDLSILAAGHEQLPDPKALGPDLRRRLRAKAILTEARRLNLNLDAPTGDERLPLRAHPRNATFDQMINK